ncbi:MAG: DUF6442 family protein [Erysipelotrichaceae bacterium]
MEKEEILARQRKSKEDEGETYAMDQSLRFGLVGMVAMFFVTCVANFILSPQNLAAVYAAMSMIWAFLCAFNLKQYMLLKTRRILVLTIINGLTALITFLTLLIVLGG